MDVYAPFQFRDYRLLLLGTFLSSFGLQMLSLAVSWDLYLATRSAIVLGNVGFVQVAPFLIFALFAGHIADVYDRRAIMAITQLLLLAGTVLLLIYSRSVPMIYACLFLNATARAFQGPSRQSILSHIVPMEALGKAITWSSSAQEIATVSGPALAGILLATVGSRAVYLVQLGCVLITLFCFTALRHRSELRVDQPARDSKSLLEGLRFVWNTKLVLSAMSLDLFAVLFGGATALLPIYAVDILHTGARGLGWLRAAPSIGAVTMALILAHTPKIEHAGRAMLWSVAGFGAATIVFGVSHSLLLSFVMLVLTGVFDNVSVVLRQSLVQMETPAAVRGRVLAVNAIFISSSNQLGAVESGWTAAWLGPIGSVVGGGAATIAVVAAFAAGSVALRRWRQ